MCREAHGRQWADRNGHRHFTGSRHIDLPEHQLCRLRTRIHPNRDSLRTRAFRRPVKAGPISPQFHKRSRREEGTKVDIHSDQIASEQVLCGADDGNRTRVFSLGSFDSKRIGSAVNRRKRTDRAGESDHCAANVQLRQSASFAMFLADPWGVAVTAYVFCDRSHAADTQVPVSRSGAVPGRRGRHRDRGGRAARTGRGLVGAETLGHQLEIRGAKAEPSGSSGDARVVGSCQHRSGLTPSTHAPRWYGGLANVRPPA